jgi:hypothetical protein
MAYEENKRGGGDPICVAFVGINFAVIRLVQRAQALANRRQEVQTPDTGSCTGRAATYVTSSAALAEGVFGLRP